MLAAALFPGCATASDPCTVTSSVDTTLPVIYAHTGPVTIPRSVNVSCITAFCQITVQASSLVLQGRVRAPIIVVEVTGTFNADGGSLDSAALGQPAEAGSRPGASATASPGGGGGYGGAGQDACEGSNPSGGAVVGSATSAQAFLGSGGGNGMTAEATTKYMGGSGGGAVQVTAGTMEVGYGARFDATGGDGDSIDWDTDGSGGGSGGTIIVIADEFVFKLGGGTFTARGGHSTPGNSLQDVKSGAGGGGRVYVTSQTGDIPLNIELRADGGKGLCGVGGTGSVFKKQANEVCTREGAATLFTCNCEGAFLGDDCDECPVGFFGPDCTFACPDCGDHGSCSHLVSGSGCTCDAGWTGGRCDDCAPDYFGASCDRCVWCGEHAHCLFGLGGSGDCECDEGWIGAGCDSCNVTHYGTLCENECPPCTEHGACDWGFAGTGECVCQVGWAGALCDECDDGFYGPACADNCTDCGLHGFCDDGLGGGGCTCDSEWQRPEPENLCVQCASGRFGPSCDGVCPACSADGACDEGVTGTGNCVCDPGFFGALCDQECPDCGSNGSCNDGRTGSGECECDAGFAGDACETCAAGFFGASCDGQCGNCGANAFCDDGPGGAGCTCVEHWMVPADGSSHKCVECEPGRWGPTCTSCRDCGALGRCNNGTTGNGKCSCDEGIFGVACVGVCPDCLHGVCSDDSFGSGLCVCDRGWTAALCDKCAPTFYGLDCGNQCPFCGPHARCDDGLQGGGCVCADGWARTTEGGDCDRCDVGFFGPTCLPCPLCGPHGTCDWGLSGTGKCVCELGWAGDRCDKCRSGFFGPDCEGSCPVCDTVRACDDGPDGLGVCVCTGGWTGTDCSTCPPNWKGTECGVCAAGYFGPHCDPCPCDASVGAICDDGLSGSGNCTCPTGYTGAQCNACEAARFTSLCVHCPACGDGASCDGGVAGTGACECDNGYDGVDCRLRSTSTTCATDAEGVGSGILACMPGSRTLEFGFDLVTGRSSPLKVFSAGIADGEDLTRRTQTLRAGGILWDIPFYADFDNVAVSAPSQQDVVHGPTLVGSTADAREWAAAAQLGLTVTGSSTLGGALFAPAETAAASEGVLQAAAILETGSFLAAYSFTRVLYRMSNEYSPPPPSIESIVVGPLGSGGVLATPADVLARFTTREDVAALVGRGVGDGVGVAPPGAGAAPGLRTAVGFRKAVAALPEHLPAPPAAAAGGSDPAWDAYLRFVSLYGTHYVRSVDVGGRVEVMGAATMCRRFGELRADSELREVIDANLDEALASGGTGAEGDFVADVRAKFAGMRATVRVTGGDDDALTGTTPVDDWYASVPELPRVVGREVAPLHELVQDVVIASNLRRAIDHYRAAAARAAPAVAAVPGGVSGGGANATAAEEVCAPVVKASTLFFINGAGHVGAGASVAGVLACVAVSAWLVLANPRGAVATM